MWRSENGCAVRVIFTHHVADDARALLVRPVPVVVQFVHREQHAAMHRLQAVACIGQSPTHDHAHGVVEIRTSHLLFEADGDGFLGELGHWASGSKPLSEGPLRPLQARQWGDSKGLPRVAPSQQARSIEHHPEPK
jgi:hypothetical protein